MYKHFIRPVLFLIRPETVHHIIVTIIKIICIIPGFKNLIRTAYEVKDKRLMKECAGLTFDNPVGLAAGFDKDARIFNEFANFGFSFIEIGTVTPKPQSGNPKTRLFRIPGDKGLINRMGFNNHGVYEAAERLKKKKADIIIGGNIGKNTVTPNEMAVNDYEECFKVLYDVVDYFVVNVSCPNINDLSELQDKDSLSVILYRLAHIRASMDLKKPIFVKISPDLNFDQIDDVLELVNQTKMDGIVATNTTIQRDHLKTDFARLNKIGRGGLSGSPLRDRSTEIIRYVSEKTKGELPVIGVGGIMSAEDALEKIRAGATLLQIYTGFIYEGPGLVKKINKEILR